jgi:hypothetical protein
MVHSNFEALILGKDIIELVGCAALVRRQQRVGLMGIGNRSLGDGGGRPRKRHGPNITRLFSQNFFRR